MGKYLVLLMVVLLVSSCGRPRVKRDILLKYHWMTMEYLAMDGVDFVFTEHKNDNRGCSLWVSNELSVYKDGEKIGVIEEANDTLIRMKADSYDYPVNFERWIEKRRDERQ